MTSETVASTENSDTATAPIPARTINWTAPCRKSGTGSRDGPQRAQPGGGPGTRRRIRRHGRRLIPVEATPEPLRLRAIGRSPHPGRSGPLPRRAWPMWSPESPLPYLPQRTFPAFASRMKVAGPSFTRDTDIIAPNTPVATATPRDATASTKAR